MRAHGRSRIVGNVSLKAIAKLDQDLGDYLGVARHRVSTVST
jgi:hypothetical protein